jgi:preprotein translocase subunit SecA
MMEGRRYSEGLHQALSKREGVTVQNENTLASITFQIISIPEARRMTGTAMTGSRGVRRYLQADVIEIDQRPCIRADNDDEVYRTTREKNDAVSIDGVRRPPTAGLVWQVSTRNRRRCPSF